MNLHQYDYQYDNRKPCHILIDSYLNQRTCKGGNSTKVIQFASKKSCKWYKNNKLGYWIDGSLFIPVSGYIFIAKDGANIFPTLASI